MDHAYIRTLIEALEASTLTELEFSQNGSTLRLAKALTKSPTTSLTASGPQDSAAAASERSLPPAVAAAPAAVPVTAATQTLSASMYGVVHLQASPGAPAYVSAGQRIKAGQTLCVIEAMKIFNEVQAEEDLLIEAILVKSGEEVEAGQALFKFQRSGADV
jgi:acetyl-CoA carboxylase biotin carboxyl carrier protein